MSSERKLRVGKIPSASTGNSAFWSLKEGETVSLTLLVDVDEVVSVDQYALWDINPAPVWVDCGDDDPGKDLGLEPGYRAFVPVAVVIDGTEEVKIWSIGIGVHRELAEIASMSDGLKGLIVRAKRTGSGIKTRYTIVSTGKRATKMPKNVPSVDEICKALGPEDRDGIIEMIEQKAGMSFAKLKAKMVGAKNDDGIEEVETDTVPF